MERSKVLKLKVGRVFNSYTVEFPTIQQTIDIESQKVALSKNKYGDLIMTGTKSSNRALDLIDMCSYFSILCPKLLLDLKVDIGNIDTLDCYEGLMALYKTDFVDWWVEYEMLLDSYEKKSVEASNIETTSTKAPTEKETKETPEKKVEEKVVD